MKPIISNDYVIICKDANSVKTFLCQLTTKDSVTFSKLIIWLNEKGAAEGMPTWEMYKIDSRPTSAQRMVDKLAFHGRYDETDKNGEYYGDTNPLLEQHLSGVEIITAHTLLKMTGLNDVTDIQATPHAQDKS
jgi:hypothetical protein